ncbi:MAG: hypothetical protein Q8P61_09510 [Candidatus Nanopelagicales bacterium]|nr:hypothetical protein [Candidatus Nanopelagicales bacterium]
MNEEQSGRPRNSGANDEWAASDKLARRRARWLDLRTYLASLFLIFGVVVTGAGITASPAQIAKAAGINLSLWTGLALIVLGTVFLLWLLRVPPVLDNRPDANSEG